MIIGKFFSSVELGYYQKGQQIPQTLMTAIDGSFTEVLYPTLSIVQNDKIRLKKALRRSMKMSMFITFPILFGLLATSEEIVIILLTDKWIDSVPFIQLSCIICCFWPLSARTHALNAIGKSDITFKVSIVSKIITLFFIVFCIRFGIYAILVGTIIASFITVWITSYYINKYIQYQIREFLQDIIPPLILAIMMAIVVEAVGRIEFNIVLNLIIQILTGATVYFIGAWSFKIDSLDYILKLIKKYKCKII